MHTGAGAAKLRHDLEEARKQVRTWAATAERLAAELKAEEAKDARTTAFHTMGGSLLLALTDDSLVQCAMSLSTATQLLCLALTSRRFTLRAIQCCAAGPAGQVSAVPPGAVDTAAQAQEEMLSIVEEAARRLWGVGTEQERGWTPRRLDESWVRLLHEVEQLRLPLVFSIYNTDDVILSNNGRSIEISEDYGSSEYVSACCGRHVMRAGRHYATFSGELVCSLMGITHADHLLPADPESFHFWGVDGVLVKNSHTAPVNKGIYWPGMQDIEDGDEVGLLLDLDQGSLAVYINGERRGLIVPEGLRGPYVWSLEMYADSSSPAIIEAGLAPTVTKAEEEEFERAAIDAKSDYQYFDPSEWFASFPAWSANAGAAKADVSE